MSRIFLVVALLGGFAVAQERSVADLHAVCNSFGNMDNSAPAQLLQQLGGQISTPDLEAIRERCAKKQYHIGMFFGKTE